MKSSFGASVHLYSNQFHFAMKRSLVNIIIYLTTNVCYKVEEVTTENHKIVWQKVGKSYTVKMHSNKDNC